jgi:alkylhydroperoxidase family enzyme
LRSALSCIEKLTLAPEQFGSEDVLALRARGLADRAIVDAIYICVGFNIINRVADALGVQVPPPKVFARGVKFSLLFGYKMMSGLQIGSTGSRASTQLKMDEAQIRDNALDDPYACQVTRLKETVLAGPGALDPALRQAACLAAERPDALAPYVKKVSTHAYKVTDNDMTALRQTGYSDDQIFEATVSASLGAGLVRLEAGMCALRGKP